MRSRAGRTGGLFLGLFLSSLCSCGVFNSTKNEVISYPSPESYDAVKKGEVASDPLAPYSGPDTLLETDHSKRSAAIHLVAGEDRAGPGYDFNRFSSGALIFKIPPGWKVTISLVNKSPIPQSVVLVPAEERGSSPFFETVLGSAPEDYRQGLSKKTDMAAFTFLTGETGTFDLVGGVPGHADLGQWAELDVEGAAFPAVLVRK